MHDVVVRDLEAARDRTLGLTDLGEPTLVAQHDPLMSPLVWDLAHVGQQEELWLLRGGDPARLGMLTPDVDALYDAFKHPRAERPGLPLLPPVEARAYDHEVRGRVLDLIERTPAGDLFTAAWSCSTKSSTTRRCWPPCNCARVRRCCSSAGRCRPVARSQPTACSWPAGGSLSGWTRPASRFRWTTSGPAHTVDVGPFWIGRVPVSNRQWREFIAGGGYQRPRVVVAARLGPTGSRLGWSGRCSGPPRAPGAASGSRRKFLPTSRCSTSATSRPRLRWAGGRLPTEAEWEKACAWDPVARARRPWPWGTEPPGPALANLSGLGLRPAPVGAYPGSASAYGAEQMIGDVWEWTSSDFTPGPASRR